MKAGRLAAVAAVAVGTIGIAVIAAPTAAEAANVSCTSPDPATQNNCLRINSTGANQAFVVPKGATNLSALLWGAGGGGSGNLTGALNGSGGGGFVSGNIAAVPGQTLNITVGQGGAAGSSAAAFGGGGASGTFTFAGSLRGGSGGGMSAIWDGTPNQAATALLVAGGGGGAPASSTTNPDRAGGGGGLTGGAGGSAIAGGGGGPSAGGTAGTNANCTAVAGSQFQGGRGGNLTIGAYGETGAGGGGGWFGGGGGACSGTSPAFEGGGGGGSSYIAASVSGGATESGALGTTVAAAPGGSSNPLWEAAGGIGLGTSATSATGGNGQVVLLFNLPQPTLDAPADGTLTGNAMPQFAGTGVAGTEMTVRDENGNSVCSATVAPTGDWSCAPSSTQPDGAHSYTSVAADPASPDAVYPPSAAAAVTIDATAPAKPVITAPADGADLSDSTPTFSGTGEAGATVEVKDENGDVICSVTVPAGGAWSCTPATALPEGDHTFTAEQTDPAGNVSPAGDPVNVKIDTTAPAKPVITSPADGDSTNDTTPTFSGTGEAGATVEVKDQNGDVVCSVTVPAGGTWSCTPATALPAGDHTFTAEQTDPAGNTSPAGDPVNVKIDTTDPVAPVITSPADGDTTNDSTPTFSGTGEAGATVEVKDENGDVICSVTVPAGGTWSCTPATALPEGDHTFTAEQTDPAGNVSPAGDPVNVKIDTTAPAKPVITAPADGADLSDSTPTFSGTGEEGATVEVKDENGDVVCSVTVPAGGTWSCTPATALPEGDHTFTAEQTDPAGNVSPVSDPVNVKVDTTDPAKPVITSPADGDEVNDTTPTFSGTGEAGATVEVKDENGDVICSVTVPAGGAWSCTPATALPEGDHTFTAEQTDPAGNVSPASDPVKVVVDTTAPAAPGDVRCEINADGTVTCTGTGTEAGDTIVVRDSDGNVICEVEVPAGLDWSCTTTGPVEKFPLTIVEKDPAGNESPQVTTPGRPTITSPVTGKLLSTPKPVFAGTGTVGATIEVRDDAGTVLCQATVGADGQWSCTSTVALGEGSHTVSAVEIGADGVELGSSPVVFSLDLTAPAPAKDTVCVQNQNGTVTCTGTAEPGSTVEITDPAGNVVCSVLVPASGDWTCTSSGKIDAGQLTVTVIDPAGNRSIGTVVKVTPYQTGETPKPVKPGGGLAETGAPEGVFLMGGAAALLLLLTGGVLVGARRRQHR